MSESFKSITGEFDNSQPEQRLLISKVKLMTWCTIHDTVIQEKIHKAKMQGLETGIALGFSIACTVFLIMSFIK